MPKLPNLPNVEFTLVKLLDFKCARQRAIVAGKPSFTWNGHEFDVVFAKYVIEYLTNEFAKGGRHG